MTTPPWLTFLLGAPALVVPFILLRNANHPLQQLERFNVALEKAIANDSPFVAELRERVLDLEARVSVMEPRTAEAAKYWTFATGYVLAMAICVGLDVEAIGVFYPRVSLVLSVLGLVVCAVWLHRATRELRRRNDEATRRVAEIRANSAQLAAFAKVAPPPVVVGGADDDLARERHHSGPR